MAPVSSGVQIRHSTAETIGGRAPSWARRIKGHGCRPGTAVQPPLGLDMPYRTGYGNTERSGDARRGQAASAARGDSGAHHREAEIVPCRSIARGRYEETGLKQDRGVMYG